MALLATILMVGQAQGSDEKVLVDFTRMGHRPQVATTDAKLNILVDPRTREQALAVSTGHKRDYPGITLPGLDWNLAPFSYLALDLANSRTEEVTIFCRVDNPGADGIRNCVTGQVTLKGGEKGTLRVNLSRRPPPGIKLFGMRGTPWSLAPDPAGALTPPTLPRCWSFSSNPGPIGPFS
jgi:hypothetical protein